jgi:hypothetical protein
MNMPTAWQRGSTARPRPGVIAATASTTRSLSKAAYLDSREQRAVVEREFQTHLGMDGADVGGTSADD